MSDDKRKIERGSALNIAIVGALVVTEVWTGNLDISQKLVVTALATAAALLIAIGWKRRAPKS
jgi:hypothetical protein